MSQNQIYFDHNATSPVDSRVLPQLANWVATFGNPSSIHWAGRGPKAILRNSRKSIAKWLNVTPLEIVFTSGGSEANNSALQGALRAMKSSRKQIVISAVEHPSVFKTSEFLKTLGYQVDLVPVDRRGNLNTARFEQLLSANTALVSVMFANNETGHIFPVKELAEKAHKVGALVHSDAVQALGKVPVDLRHMDVDFASFSAHKTYSLKGCGFLYIKQGTPFESLIFGGGQERGRRAGTENILSIASIGYMADLLAKESSVEYVRSLRDFFESELLAAIGGIDITGPENLRLPNTSSLMISGIDGETLLMNLDVKGFAVSTGAACSAGSPEPSPVLLAMGFTRAEAQCSLRVSFGKDNTKEQVLLFIEALKEVVARLRNLHTEAEAI